MATGARTRGLSTAAWDTAALCAEKTQKSGCRLHIRNYQESRNAKKKCFVSLKSHTYISYFFFFTYLCFLLWSNIVQTDDVIARVQLVHFVWVFFPPPPLSFLCSNLVSSVWARRGHDANTLTCDWRRRSCGWVDVNARYKRACKEPVFNLAVFSVQCPPDRVEPRVCVSNLVTSLYTSNYSCFFETHTAAPW